MEKSKKEQILARMQRYCALQDRSIQKIREKLYAIDELTEMDRDAILTSLLKEKFLDEERFVEAFIRSKINQNKWGRNKIVHGLIRHHIPQELIHSGLEQMDKNTYRENLIKLLAGKQKTTEESDKWVRYLLQKGYAYEEIMGLIQK